MARPSTSASSLVSAPAATRVSRGRRLATGASPRLAGKPRAAAGDPPGPRENKEPGRIGRSVHWSAKITGGEARDELRYMDSRTLRGKESGLPWDLQSVWRDRDNITFVGDEALVIPFLARELGCTDDQATEWLQRLVKVLPALTENGRLGKVGVKRLAKLCNDLPGVVQRLLQLKDLFPACDVGTMVSCNPFLLTEGIDIIVSGLETLRELFPFAGKDGTPGVDRMVQAVPQLLDSEFASAAMTQLKRLYGELAPEMVHRNPLLVLQVESSSLRSRYSVSFDQAHVRANKVIPLSERIDEPYYRT